jgi:hypothetical protein
VYEKERVAGRPGDQPGLVGERAPAGAAVRRGVEPVFARSHDAIAIVRVDGQRGERFGRRPLLPVLPAVVADEQRGLLGLEVGAVAVDARSSGLEDVEVALAQ